jgi:leucine dehydrogenase
MNTLQQMVDRGHEYVAFHQDPDSGLRAVVAVHSTTLGPGFGGARRWHYATQAEALYDVLRLSEGMTYKSAVAGIPMGGGKAVIMLPQPNHAAAEAEARAMGRFVQKLGGLYISAEDVGLSPQYIDWMAMETKWVIGGITRVPGGDPSPHTARGVVNAMKAALAYTGRPVDFAGVTVAIQGAGNVGGNIARILSGHRAKILISDISQEKVRRVAKDTGATVVAPDEILTARCDILAPCALGGVIDASTISRLRCDIICGGANNVLDDYDEDGVALKGRGIVYVPDFVANAGGLIHLAGIYIDMSEEERQQKIADIEPTVLQILHDAESAPSTFAAGVALAKQRIAEGAKENVHAG